MTKKEKEKIHILTISDHPLSPSGVGTQTKYFIVELLKTGKFKFSSIAGAIRHDNYNPQKVEDFGDDWVIYPVKGYGDPETIRSVLRTHKPDILWFMTDPRFYTWLWEMENEIRSLVPMVYYHVWDNYPYPEFNNVWYNSNDAIVTISKLTSDIVRKVSPKVREKYIPHSVPEELFQTKSDTFRKNFRKSNFKINEEDDHIMFFWNNRNARRKQSGSLIYWFKKFLDQLYDKHENAKATLIMHTAANDPNGQDLHAIINSLGLNQDGKREVLISESKMEPDVLANLYSAVDCTINISDAEGFGLATFESLACGTPIITTMTGGLQEQVTKLNKVTHDDMLKRNSNNPGFTVYEHGIGLEPSSKAIIGSQQVPYIYEDRLCEKQFVDSMMTMYELGHEKRREMGQAGAEHIVENYNFQKNSEKWIEFIENIHDECGSWENRKKYKNWELREIL